MKGGEKNGNTKNHSEISHGFFICRTFYFKYTI